MLLKYLVLLLIQCKVILAQEFQCHVKGQCSGIVVGANTTDSYNLCLDLCKNDEYCHWITHQGDTSQCIKLYNCPLIDDSNCENCFSGQVECEPEQPVCNANGICHGHYVTSNHTDTADACLAFCQSVPECKWYSYYTDTTDCILMDDCFLFDESCTYCLTGERDCQLVTDPRDVLFVIGGNGAEAGYDVEILHRQNATNCPVADYPVYYASVGTYIEGHGILVCGGGISGTDADNSCYTYIPSEDRWQANGTMLQRRRAAAAVQLSPTQWWITGGGVSGSTTYLSSTEMFTLGEGFSAYANLPVGTGYHNLVKVNSTHVMLLGGLVETAKSWLFSTVTEAWTPLPDLPYPTGRAQAGLVTHANGTLDVVVMGGRVRFTQIFSFETFEWRRGTDFPPGGLQGGASLPYGDTFLVVGGVLYQTGSKQSSIYEYQGETGGWLELPQRLVTARDIFAAFFVPDDLVTCALENA